MYRDSLIIHECCFDGYVLYEMLYRYLPFGRAAAAPEILRKPEIHISIFPLGPLTKGSRAAALTGILRKPKIHISIFSLGPLTKGSRAAALTEILRNI